MESLNRYFVALPVSSAVRAYLERLQAHLQRTFGQSVRWVAPDKIHMTVQFLGALAPAVVAHVQDTMRMCLPPVFTLTLQSMDFFCHRSKPKVLFAQTDEPVLLNRLVTCTRSATEHIVVDTQPFVPHITLGRFRERVERGYVQEGLEPIAIEPLSWQIDQVNIYRSKRTESGKYVYSIEYSLELP